MLKIQKLTADINRRDILKNISLTVPLGKIAAIMGPNGSGKSTLAHALMGHPDYRVTNGRIIWRGHNLLRLEAWQRARIGVFLGFQNPTEITGVNLFEFLLTAHQAVHHENTAQKDFDRNLKQALKTLRLTDSFLERPVNEGFSGGEKKKAEMLQLLVLQPSLIVLDEIDSGLDIDALKLIAKTIRLMRSSNRIILVITHYQRLLNLLKPDFIHILLDGRIVKSGRGELVKKLERQGYDWLKNKQA